VRNPTRPRSVPGTAALSGLACSAARSSVPSPPIASTISMEPSGVGGVEDGQVEFAALPGQGQQLDTGFGESRSRRTRGDRDVWSASVRHQQHAADRHQAPLSTAAAMACRRRATADSSVGASCRRCTKNSTLPLGPGNREAVTPARPHPSRPASPDDLGHRAGPVGERSRTTPPAPSRSRPTSNCRLTIGTRSAPGAAQAVSGQRQGQGDERQIGHDQDGRAAGRLRREGPDVRPVVQLHPARRSAAATPADRSQRRRQPPPGRRGGAARR